MSEVKRYHVTEAGLVEGQSLGRINVVLGADHDRVTAERDALQRRLTAADERVDLLERDKARIDWLAEQPVDTLYLDDGRIIDIAGRIDLRDAIDAAMAAPKPVEGEGDE
ncbi:hypothetical protein [Pseudomonas antarctica]|uniref:hypothetical protein n=1 Tax=Pseudomonas antarctica TaxID=219572 RepID=UPI00387B1DA2